jgi:allophanate hydrolase subunit 2
MSNKTWDNVPADWNVAGDWGPTPGIPGTGDTAIFNSNSAYLVTIGTQGGATEFESVAGVTLQDGAAELEITAGSTLAVAGSIDVVAGILALNGLLSGGTLEGNGNGELIVQNGGTLSAVTIGGSVTAVAPYATIDVTGGLAFQPGGTLVLFGAAEDLAFLDSETLGAGKIVLASQYYAGVLIAGSAHTETFAAGFTLDVDDSAILSGSFANLGTIIVEPADQLTVSVGSFVNQGVIEVGSGGVIALNGSLGSQFVNAGSIALAGGVVEVGGTLTTAQLVALAGEVSGSGTIDFIGTLLNSGQTLSLTSLSRLQLDGDVIGGTIVDSNAPQITGGTLDGVTVQGVLNYGTAEYITIAIRDGLTLQSAPGVAGGSIVMGGLSDSLELLDGTTLGPVVLDMNQTGQNLVSETPTLTLGAGFTLVATGNQDYVEATTLINAGSIGVSGSGVSGSVASLDLDTATLTNNGIISAGAGAVLSIDTSTYYYGYSLGQPLSLGPNGTFALTNGATLVLGADQTTAQLLNILGTSSGVAVSVLGTLVNSGTTLDVAAGTPLGTLTLAADVIGGTIINAGSLTVGASTFQSLTFGGVLNFANDVQINVAQGLTFEPGSTVDFSGAYDYLNVTDAETLNGAVFNLSGNYDEIIGATNTLSFGTGLTVDVTGSGATIRAQTGALTNNGTIAVTGTSASLQLVVETLVNNGTIAVGAGDALTITEAVYGSPPAGLFDAGTFALASGASLILDSNQTTGQVQTILGTSTGVLVTIENTLNNANTVLAVSNTGTLSNVTLNADVLGGTIVNGGGTLAVTGGTLQGVTYEGLLNLAGAGGITLRVSQGLTLENALGGAGGTVDLASTSDTMAILDTETLDGAVFNITGANDTISGTTLSLGAGLTVGVTGADATISASTLANAGIIAVTGTTASLALDTATFANNGIVSVGAGAGLTIGADSNGNSLAQTLALSGTGATSLASGASLTLGADKTTAQLISVLGTATGVAVTLLGTLVNSGTVVDVVAGGQIASLTVQADVIGGTIVNAGSVAVGASTFQGVTFVGPLNLNAYDQLAIAQGLTLENASGGAGGTLNATGNYSSLQFTDSETLTGATVNLSGAYGDAIDGSTLTLGNGLTVNVTGALESINVTTLTNAGTIEVAGNATSLTVNASSLSNTGTMAASGNGAVLALVGTSITNAGLLSIAGTGASLTLDTATLANTGVISVGAGAALNIGVATYGSPLPQTLTLSDSGSFALASGSALTLGADQTTGQLLTVLGTSTGVLVSVLGTLFNSGAVLDVTANGTLSDLALQADVIGGTIVNAGGTLSVGTGTLQGVTFDGPLRLAPAGNVLLNVAQGLTLNAAAGTPGGEIDILSNYDKINITDSETLNGAVVNIGGIGAAIDATTLTLGKSLNLDVTGSAIVQVSTLTNAGTIQVASGGYVDLLYTTFSNSGIVSVASGGTLAIEVGGTSPLPLGAVTLTSGSTLEVGGTETTAQLLALLNGQTGVTVELLGTLINSGASITLGSGLLGNVILDADVIGGTIVAGPSLTVTGGTLSGVTVVGTLALNGYDDTLTVTNGLTLQSPTGGTPGTLDLAGLYNTLVIADAETLDQASIVASGAYDVIAANNGTLSFGPQLTLDATGSVFLSAGTLVNAGTIIVGGTASVLKVGGATIAGSGLISVGSGDALAIDQSSYNSSLGGSLSLPSDLVLAAGGIVELGGTATAGQIQTMLGASTGAVVESFSTVIATGTTLDLSASGSLAALTLEGGSDFIGGTIVDGDHGLTVGNGTLDGVTIDGRLTIAAYEYGYVVDSFHLAGQDGTGHGSIALAGPSGGLYFEGNETLANVIANIATSDLYLIATKPTLDIGASATLTVGGALTLSGTTIVNAGTITTTGGGAVVIESGTILDSGIIAVGAGGTLVIDGADSYNYTTDAYGPYGLNNPLDLAGGSISVAAGGTLVIGSTETTAQLLALLGSIAPSGVVLDLLGTLINTGATLAIGSTGLGNVVLDADVVGGVIAENSGSLTVTGGTFDAVTFQGPLDLTQNNTDITLLGGLSFASGGTIAVTGTGDLFNIADNETLNGVFITIAPAPLVYDYGYYYQSNTIPGLTVASNVGTLALGSGVTIDTSGLLTLSAGTVISSAADIVMAAGTVYLDAPTIAGAGSISVGSGAELEINGAAYGVTLDVANPASISLAAGSTLLVDGVLSTAALLTLVDASFQKGVELILQGGTLLNTGLNTGATLDIAPGLLGNVVLDDTIIGGTVINGGGLLTFETVDFQTVTMVGNLVLGEQSILSVTGGLTVLNPVAGLPGSIALTSYESTIAFGDSETLDNVVLTDSGSVGTLTDSGTLTFGQHAAINVTGELLATGGELVNNGIITVTGTASSFDINTGTFVNNGVVAVGAGDLLALNLSPQSTTGLSLYGTGGSFILSPGATLGIGGAVTAPQLANLLTNIHSNGGVVELDGTLLNTGSVFSSVAGTDLADVLINGTVIGGTLTNGTGTLTVADATFSGVTYQGPLSIGAYNTLSIENGVTLVGTAGSGPGTLTLDEGANLNFLDNETLANTVVNFAANEYFGDISFQALTLASSTALNVTGNEVELQGDTLVNDGTLSVTGTAGFLDIVTPTFFNNGVISVGAGDTLQLEGYYEGYDDSYYYYLTTITYGGSGAINLARGSTLNLSADESTGQILALAGSIVGSQAGVTVAFLGYINNTGTSFDFEPGGSLGNVILDADITGGSVINASGSVTVSGGTLNGVAWQGVLDLGASSYLTIDNGLTLAAIGGGPGTLFSGGTTTTTNTLLLAGAGLQSLANLLITGPGGLKVDAQGGLNSQYVVVNPGTLAITNSVTSDLGGVLDLTTGGAGTVVNAGTLSALTAGSGIAFSAQDVVNTGDLVIDAGALLGIAGLGVPSLTNSAGGVISIASGATLLVGGSLTPGSLEALVGSLVSAPNVTVGFGSVANAGGNVLTVAGSFVIPSTGSLSSFYFDDGDVVGGGTVVNDGTVTFDGFNEFDNITYVGSITSTVADSYLVLAGTAALLSGTGGPELISLLGTQSGLELTSTGLSAVNRVTASDVQINNAVIDFGAGATTLDGYAYGDEMQVYGGTLTLGATTTVDANSGFTVYVDDDPNTGSALVNNGTIVATGGSVTIETYSGVPSAAGVSTANDVGAFVNNGLLIAGPGGSTLSAGSAALTVSGSVVNTGTIAVSGADSFVVSSANFSNTGLVELSAGATIDFATSPAIAGTILLADGAETVRLDSANGFAATLQDFSVGDTIDLTFLAPGTGTIAYANNVLDVTEGGATVAAISLPGFAYPAKGFSTSADASGNGTDISAPCFHAGTRIRTTAGEIAVEDLQVGAEVLTQSGATRPVVWIGQRRLDCTRHPRPHLVLPIRVRAGAFGDGLPARDLVLSPDHSLFVASEAGGGVLVPVYLLLNGATIVRDQVAEAHYFHVELSAHDVLFAEGLPAESYLDTGNRASFANGGAHLVLHPDFSPLGWEDACAPLCQTGPIVAEARRRLLARAVALGYRKTPPTPPLVIASGRAIRASAVVGGVHRFLLPAHTGRVQIVSDTGVPEAGDCRQLGVAIGGIVAHGQVVALDSGAPGSGFYEIEQWNGQAGRWTDGGAWLTLKPRATPGVLELRVIDALDTWQAPEEGNALSSPFQRQHSPRCRIGGR